MCDGSGNQAEIISNLLIQTRFRRVDVVNSTGSTNADVAGCAKAGAAEGYVLIAGEQTQGRGRLGRSWVSPSEASLAMSILLRPKTFQTWGWLSLIAGMAVTCALQELAESPERITLKWPNDVLIDTKKVCGILAEQVKTPQGPAAVIGIGINLTLSSEQLPVPQATSLLIAGLPTERNRVAVAVLRQLDYWYQRLLAEGPLVNDYRKVCASIGTQLKIIVNEQQQVAGIGVGIDSNGRLMVNVDGKLRSFAAGDVVHAKLS